MKTKKNSLFLLLICLEYSSADSVTKTCNGPVSGTEMRTRKGRQFLAFSGIPYAEPPINELRFRSPIRKKNWHGVLLAHKDGNECTQLKNGIHGSEDCLYLNVYTPKLDPKASLPVMAYIHGSAYAVNNASRIYAGPNYLLEKDIVLVTFNYRLGIFGFLSTGDNAAPGNFGMKDQVMALQWIQENIRNFGGNPDEVTLFGENSGGESTHLHTLSKKSRNLFKRYIAQSGTALYPRAFTSDPSYYDKAKKVAAIFKCDSCNTVSMVDCLRRVKATDLVNTNSVFDTVSKVTDTLWRPTIEPESEDAFLSDTPANLIRKNMMKDCTLVTGNVKDEGIPFASKLHGNKEYYNAVVTKTLTTIKELLGFYEPLRGKDLNALAIKIRDYYSGLKVPKGKDPVLYKYTLLITDLFYLYPQAQFLNHLTETTKEPCYSYNFTYRGALSKAVPLDKVLGLDIVSHADDLFYLFPWTSQMIGPQYHIERTEKDYEMVDQMVDLWTSFAVKGVPESKKLGKHNVWTPFSSGTYLEIGDISKTSLTQRKYCDVRLKFWFENVPQYSLRD